MSKLHFHWFKINELDKGKTRLFYWFYSRYFLHVYKGAGDNEKEVFSGHIEALIKKPSNRSREWFSTRFHVGNAGSETPWDGHLVIFGVGLYWGHSGFRRLAEWISRCYGRTYDSRDWAFRISDGHVWWEIANHSDHCPKSTPKRKGRSRRFRTWRRGSADLSIANAIWGRKQYTYEDVDRFNGLIRLPEDSYGVIITMQQQYFGRTKVARDKHVKSWVLDVDAPTGIPTHVDHSGGWKGDRTYGFGVDFNYPSGDGWTQDAEAAVTAWVLRERARTGFRRADPIEADS